MKTTTTRATKYLETQKQGVSMAKGYCYVVYCEGFPEWCKVGFTNRKVAQRLREYQTYSPFDYELRFQCEFDDARAAEKEVHARIKTMASKSREWFKISPKLAANIIESVKEELDTWGEFECATTHLKKNS